MKQSEIISMNKFVALLASISPAFSPATVFLMKTPMKHSDHEAVWLYCCMCVIVQ